MCVCVYVCKYSIVERLPFLLLWRVISGAQSVLVRATNRQINLCWKNRFVCGTQRLLHTASQSDQTAQAYTGAAKSHLTIK